MNLDWGFNVGVGWSTIFVTMPLICVHILLYNVIVCMHLLHCCYCDTFDVSFKPAIDDIARFTSWAAWPVGNLINCPCKLAMPLATSLMHLPAELLETERESPIKRCRAPVAKNRKHKRSCKRGGRGWFLRVGLARLGRSLKIYMMLSGLNRYRSNTSSSSRSSKGFDRSLNTLGRLCWYSTNLARIANLLCAAISVLSMTLSKLQSLLEKSPFCTPLEYEYEYEKVL